MIHGQKEEARVCATSLQLCLMLFDPMDWTAARQARLSMGFPRQEYWTGLPCPPPGGIPTPGIEPISLTSPALTGGFVITSAAPIKYILN